MKQEAQELSSAFIEDIETIPADMSVSSLIGYVANAPCGLPVVDKQNRYQGVVTKTALLEALDREGDELNA